MNKGKELKLDEDVESSCDLPAFLSKPDGAPVYYGFPLVKETCIDGWCYGAITEYIEEGGCKSGDGYVQAPDGSRAGLAWTVGEFKTIEVCEPDKGRWGVYEVAFPKTIYTVDDLVDCFEAVLPELKAIYKKIHGISE